MKRFYFYLNHIGNKVHISGSEGKVLCGRGGVRFFIDPPGRKTDVCKICHALAMKWLEAK